MSKGSGSKGSGFLSGVSSDTRRYVRELKNKVYNYTEMEQMVREATCNDTTPPPPQLMREIAKGTFTVEFPAIMQLIWKRVKDPTNENHPFKCMILLEFLLREGNSDMVMKQINKNKMYIEQLQHFVLYDEQQRDIGGKVRTKAAEFLRYLREGDAPAPPTRGRSVPEPEPEPDPEPEPPRPPPNLLGDDEPSGGAGGDPFGGDGGGAISVNVGRAPPASASQPVMKLSGPAQHGKRREPVRREGQRPAPHAASQASQAATDPFGLGGLDVGPGSGHVNASMPPPHGGDPFGSVQASGTANSLLDAPPQASDDLAAFGGLSLTPGTGAPLHGAGDPFGGGGDPFSTSGGGMPPMAGDPFASAGAPPPHEAGLGMMGDDPFAAAAPAPSGGVDPFASAGPGAPTPSADPFAAMGATTGVPPSASAGSGLSLGSGPQGLVGRSADERAKEAKQSHLGTGHNIVNLDNLSISPQAAQATQAQPKKAPGPSMASLAKPGGQTMGNATPVGGVGQMGGGMQPMGGGVGRMGGGMQPMGGGMGQMGGGMQPMGGGMGHMGGGGMPQMGGMQSMGGGMMGGMPQMGGVQQSGGSNHAQGGMLPMGYGQGPASGTGSLIDAGGLGPPLLDAALRPARDDCVSTSV
eukprot:CAMPEP_0206063380 /NCGR_PEP_ID=MMETSP1466-20131121/58199_1 /ASSEMBLY_ACC=CAM_ASM_001126 /TAXON_ID=44452 /ORGANISM="Pavlova gyrans, Strain CCMP608" /LENGTH=636 /DNA_ID=CAMNT_0053438749 /DNA_START=148 /DNA_END=2059 /DNA_ORIENTATION=-